jgi:hypothetical protein
MHDSSLGRLVGVLVSPVATFRSIARRPTVLAAIGYRIVAKVKPATAWVAAVLVFALGLGLRVLFAALQGGGGA